MRKLPRGKGYDKAATLKHLKAMVKGGVPVTEYVKANGLKLDTFMLALFTHHAHLLHPSHVDDPKLIQASCEQCGETFWHTRKGVRFCSPKCGKDKRVDDTYFGGKRKSTAGLAESVCGLCRRQVTKGLSSHHVFGKANDPGNDHLLALCRGCHEVVSALALKKWVANEEALERLIVLAVSQRFGSMLIMGAPVSVQVNVVGLDQTSESA